MNCWAGIGGDVAVGVIVESRVGLVCMSRSKLLSVEGGRISDLCVGIISPKGEIQWWGTSAYKLANLHGTSLQQKGNT